MLKRIIKGVGVERTPAETAEDRTTAQRHQKIEVAWRWLRTALDRSIDEYFQTGSLARLERYMESPALERLVGQLEVMREQGIVWSQPDRGARAKTTEVRVIDERLDSRGQLPVEFVVQESFVDRSRLVHLDERGQVVDQVQSPGERRILQATVVCLGAQEYRVREVRQVSVA